MGYSNNKTCIWTLFLLSIIWIIWIDTGGLPGDIIIAMPVMASLFMICSFAFYFYKSNEIIGQVILLGVLIALYVVLLYENKDEININL